MRKPALLAALMLISACSASTPPRQLDEPSIGVTRSPRSLDEAVDAGGEPAPAAADGPEIDAWLLWTLGGIPADFPGTVERLQQILRVSPVASGTSWARSWTRPDGRPARTPGGLAMPFEVASVHLPTYARFFPLRLQRALRSLERDEALVASTVARVHGLARGSLIAFPGVSLRVRGVVPDVFAGSHELLVQEPTGRTLGITSPRYLLAEAEDGVPTRSVSRALRAVVPHGVVARIRPPGKAAFLRHADLTLPQSRMKALFGEFAAAPAGGWFDVEPTWVRQNIEEARVPILGRVTCHRRAIPLIRGALHELVRRGLSRLVDPAQYGGCYAPRFIGRDPAAGLSHHAWGAAIDINVADNPLGARPTMDLRVVRAFERWGFVWGGRFLRPDGHHFEVRCFPDRCA